MNTWLLQNMICACFIPHHRTCLSRVIYNSLPRSIYHKANRDLVHAETWQLNTPRQLICKCSTEYRVLQIHISLKFTEVVQTKLTLQCRCTALYLRVQLLVDHVVLSSFLLCLHRAWSKLGCGWLLISPNHTPTTAPVLNHMIYLNQWDARYRGSRASCMYHVLHYWAS